jgi:hypothetical protein
MSYTKRRGKERLSLSKVADLEDLTNFDLLG